MTPALENTRELHTKLATRIDELSRRASSLIEEAGVGDVADALWILGADLAALVSIVEELQDRERFPVRTQTNPNGKGNDPHD